MTAIIKRELSSYFNSAIGYIVLAVFTFFSGLFFYMYCLLSNTTSMSYVFLSMLMIVMLVIPIIACYASPDWAVFLTTMLGMLLMGGALIAVDLFISALTESQVIAAVISIGVGLLIYMLDSLSNLISAEWFTAILHNLSFDAHFTNFINGIINLTSVVFFLSVIAVFLFLCVRVFEKRRWS